MVLLTANDNSSVSAHENLTRSYLIFDMHTYFHPSYFPYFCFCFYYLLKNVKLLVLAGLEENREREGYGSPLASVGKGILKNPGSRSSLVCSTGNNLTWKLSLQVVELGQTVQTCSFSRNLLTLMFPGRVCSFIWTTVTSAFKRALRCFGHHFQSKKWWTIYFGSVFSLAPIGSARGGGLEAPLTGGFLAWVESSLLGTTPFWLPLGVTLHNIWLVRVFLILSPVFMELCMPDHMLRLYQVPCLNLWKLLTKASVLATWFWPTALLSLLPIGIRIADGPDCS